MQFDWLPAIPCDVAASAELWLMRDIFVVRNIPLWYVNTKKGRFAKSEFSFVISVRLSAWNNSASTGRIFMKFDIWLFSENLPRKFKVYQNLTRITGTLLQDVCTLLITSRSILLRMRNFQTKVVQKMKTHFMLNAFFFSENETMWKIW